MYSFKYAVRTESDSNQSRAQRRLTVGPLPDHFEHAGETAAGQWYRIQLPAATWCLLLVSGDQTTSAYYHSPADVGLELKEIFNAQETARLK